jgi:hypothetical protein
MADHEPDWPITIRRQPARPGTGHPEDHTGRFEVICGKCGDDPGLDYSEVSSVLRRIRGPYPLAAGIAVFAKHDEHHDTAGETDQRS